MTAPTQPGWRREVRLRIHDDVDSAGRRTPRDAAMLRSEVRRALRDSRADVVDAWRDEATACVVLAVFDPEAAPVAPGAESPLLAAPLGRAVVGRAAVETALELIDDPLGAWRPPRP